jgi:hypothetical protein
MSIQGERELRGRLGGLLDGVEAAPPPVARAMRRGRVIRMRRWGSAVVGVAVLAAGAVVLPRLIAEHHSVAPLASRHYKVTVQPLGPTAKGGLIGTGTINGKRWRVVLDSSQGDGCAVATYLLSCGPKYGSSVGSRDVSLGAEGGDGTQFQLGTVGSDVTRVVILLSNGTAVDLRPIRADGQRWVAAAAPLHAMVGAESFVGRTEYQRSVPFVTSSYTEFVTWLGPGQPGLPRASVQVGNGTVHGVTWHTSVSAGPWGYCVAFANGGSCVSTATPLHPPRIGRLLLQFTCGPLYPRSGRQVGTSGVVVLPAGVKNVVIKFADGSRLRLVATYVAGTRAIGYALPDRPTVKGIQEFGFAGQYLGDAPASSLGC